MPALSILGLSATPARPAPVTVLVTAIVEAFVERAYSIGRVVDFAGQAGDPVHARSAGALEDEARTLVQPIIRADILVLGLALDDPDGNRLLERLAGLLPPGALLGKPSSPPRSAPPRTSGASSIGRSGLGSLPKAPAFSRPRSTPPARSSAAAARSPPRSPVERALPPRRPVC